MRGAKSGLARVCREVGRWSGVAAAMAYLAACAGGGSPPVRPAVKPVCADFSFPIYFDKASDQLTAPARQVLHDAALRVKGCRIGSVSVVGLADADGSANRNLALSRRRADGVAAALAADGLPRPSFDIEALGEAGAREPGGRPEPLRRRTEVVIRAAPPS